MGKRGKKNKSDMTVTKKKLTSVAGGDTGLEVNFATSHVKAVLLDILAGDGDIDGEAKQVLETERLVGNHVALQDVMHLMMMMLG